MCNNRLQGPGGSTSQVVRISNSPCMPISNTALVSARLCKLQKRMYLTRSRKRISCFPMVSSTSETGLHDIAELLLKATLNTKNQIINSRVCMFLQSKPGSKSELQLLNPHLCEHSFFQLQFKCVRFGIVLYLMDQMNFCLKLHQVGSKCKD